MRPFSLLSLLLIVLQLVGCGSDNKKSDKDEEAALRKVSLRQEWFPNSNYCGAIFAQEKFATPNGIEISIVAGADNIDPIKLVLSGANDFGDAGADRVIEAIGKGVDLVVIGVVNLHSPTCFVARKDKNIKTPYDFPGHKIGVLTGTSTEYVYRALMKKLEIDTKQVKEIEVPFDLGTFLIGEYDVRPAFIYDEPVSLDLQGIDYELIEPRHYGIQFMGTVYFTRREMVESDRQSVQAFVNSVADGWKATLAYPELAIEYLKKNYPDIDSNRELNALIKGAPYFAGKLDRVLWADPSDWEEMLAILRDLGKTEEVDLRKHIDNSFLETYYRNLESKQTNH
jgi:ABC-type nitrate/sulfonate/bicarbonate transport system substrate-binding protein